MSRLNSLLDPRFVFRPDIFLRALLRRRGERPSEALVETSWGDSILVNPQKFIGSQIYLRGAFELHVAETLVRLLEPGGSAIDVGANIGIMTSILSKRAGASGQVTAIEAHPRIFEQLKQNVGRWGRSNVKLLCVAASRRRESLEMLDTISEGTNEGVARIIEENSSPVAGQRFKVECEPLDDVILGRQIELIKIDVEGHELGVVEGAADSLSRSLIKHIVFESQRNYPSAAHQFLENFGYRIFRIDSAFRGPRLCLPCSYAGGNEPLADFLATRDSQGATERMSPSGWSVLRSNF